MIQDALKQVLSGATLSTEEAAIVMDQIMTGQATPAQIAGLLVALRQRGEKAEEIAGFALSMRRHAVRIHMFEDHAVDGCGTGGDSAHTFNISTAASIVASAAGVNVAKHGNRSVSSLCGSADLLESTGGNIDPGPMKVELTLSKLGFGFMFAPRFHPAMRHAAPVRKELGIRTVFNVLGPLTNPAGVQRQVIGVYDRSLMVLLADVVRLLGCKHALVVHSTDGLDEFSVTDMTEYIEVSPYGQALRRIAPEDVGLTRHPAGSLEGGDAPTNARILNDVLDGRKSAYRDAVAFNAGAMIYVGAKAGDIRDGVKIALESIDSEAAKHKLQAWIQLTTA